MQKLHNFKKQPNPTRLQGKSFIGRIPTKRFASMELTRKNFKMVGSVTKNSKR